jgi:hypothetical protein
VGEGRCVGVRGMGRETKRKRRRRGGERGREGNLNIHFKVTAPLPLVFIF